MCPTCRGLGNVRGLGCPRGAAGSEITLSDSAATSGCVPGKLPFAVRVGRTSGTCAMALLIDGEWREEVPQEGGTGEFVRAPSQLRERISADGSSGFKAAAGRYHLFVARACPWCHRTMIMRVLKRLEGVISISYVEPAMLEQGWRFARPDPLTGARFVYELYQQADPLFSGRATVPVLWDKESNAIVNNESSDILRMLNSEFDEITHDVTDYYPAALAAEIDEVN